MAAYNWDLVLEIGIKTATLQFEIIINVNVCINLKGTMHLTNWHMAPAAERGKSYFCHVFNLLTAEAFLLHGSPFPAKLNQWKSLLSIYRIWMFTPNYGKTARLKCLEVNMNKNGRLTCTKILAGDIGLRYCLLTSWLIMCWEKWAKRPRVNKRTWRQGKSSTRKKLFNQKVF